MLSLLCHSCLWCLLQASLSQNEVTVVQQGRNAIHDSDLIDSISRLGFSVQHSLNGFLTATVDIAGMACISCVRNIEQCLSVMEGIKASNVSLSDNCALVVFDSSTLSIQQICDAVDSHGFVANHNNVTSNHDEPDLVEDIVHIEGMTCVSCCKTIEDNISQMKGVASITVSLLEKLATVKFDPAVTTISAIAEVISDMGFDAKSSIELEQSALQVKMGSDAEHVKSSVCDDEAMISIGGMTCDSCVKLVQACISSLPHVRAVKVSLAENMAYVSLNDHQTTAADVAAAVSDIGFDASVFRLPAANSTCRPGSVANASEVLIRICGMHCNSCTCAIAGKLKNAVGVHSVSISLLDEIAIIQYNARLISAQQLLQIIETAGNFEAYINLEGKWIFLLLQAV